MARRVVLVGGTWSWRGLRTEGQWYQSGSPFVTYLRTQGLEVASADQPFVWTTRIAGYLGLRHRHLEWQAAGENLRVYLDWTDRSQGVTEPYHAVICHSHGLQVCLYAAAHGAVIPTLISVCGPVRQDMRDTAVAARPNIGSWLHLASDWSDPWQWFGEWCDGKVGSCREAIWKRQGKVVAAADLSVKIPGVGHSGLVRDPDHFGKWREYGWLDWI